MNKYDFIGQILGPQGTLQSFVDDVEASMYNLATWKNYFSWDIQQLSDSFDAIEAVTSIIPMASVIDSDSPKPKRAMEGFKLHSGKIPKMGHGYDLTENEIRNEIVLLQSGGAVPEQIILEKMTIMIEKIVFGIHVRLNQMVDSVMSTGHLVLDDTNNPDGGIFIDVDMKVPADNKVYPGFGPTGVSAVWTDPSATPISDLVDWKQWADDNFIPGEIFRMSKSLWRIFSTHPNVQAEVRGRLNNQVTTTRITDDEVVSYLVHLGLPPVAVIDHVQAVQADGINTNIISWDQGNVTLCANGEVGKVKNAIPLSVDDPSRRVAFSEQGRIKILEMNNNQTVTKGMEVEAIAIPILSNPTKYSIMNTTTTTVWS